MDCGTSSSSVSVLVAVLLCLALYPLTGRVSLSAGAVTPTSFNSIVLLVLVSASTVVGLDISITLVPIKML